MSDEIESESFPLECRLAAILAADIAGYSTLIQLDEDATVKALKGHQTIVLPMVAQHGGRIIDTAGDGILAEFGSIVNAVKCALDIQEVMHDRNATVPSGRRLQFRIGINQGDVLFDGDRIYGDGINVAARLESICVPGSICISGKVYDEIGGRFDVRFQCGGEKNLKNLIAPVRVYHVSTEEVEKRNEVGGGEEEAKAAQRSPLRRPRVATRVRVGFVIVLSGLAGLAGIFFLSGRVGAPNSDNKAPRPQATIYSKVIWPSGSISFGEKLSADTPYGRLTCFGGDLDKKVSRRCQWD